jgi:DNA modification methylase
MTVLVQDPDFTLHAGDALETLRELPDEHVHCIVTSPPYWGLRDYGIDGQLGLEPTPDEYVAGMVAVFREARRVLRRDGTCWLNIGDSYAQYDGQGNLDEPREPGLHGNFRVSPGLATVAENRGPGRHSLPHGLKRKDLVGVPWRLAFALQQDGWYLRADIIWSKPNPMPESVTDRPTKAHEYLFLLTRSPRYFYGTAQRARNKRSVWEIATESYPDAHFATFPQALVEPCVLAGCPEGGTVLDPFLGSGTTALVARRLGRHSIGIELNPRYAELAAARTRQLSLLAEAVAG